MHTCGSETTATPLGSIAVALSEPARSATSSASSSAGRSGKLWPVRIRAARDDDAEAVARLWTEGCTGAGADGRSTPYTAAEFRVAAGNGQPFVAMAAARSATTPTPTAAA